jgi:serine/threonine protein phosphatase PrpC
MYNLIPTPNYIKNQKGYSQIVNHTKASSYTKSNNIFHEKIIIPPIKKPSNLMLNNNSNFNSNDYFYHNYPFQQEFESYNNINNYYENQNKYFKNNIGVNNINNNQYNTNNFISSRNFNETIINNIQTYNAPQNNDTFINIPSQRINRNLSQSSYYNNTSIFNQSSFPIDNSKDNIFLNSKTKLIENSKMINLKNFTIQRNGKTIGNIDINSDCQETYLSNSNQMTNSSSKNNYKIKDNIKPYYEPFNLDNFNNNINKGKITNHKENKSKLIDLSQIGNKTRNENNSKKHQSKVKMKTNNTIKISNNVNFTKSASKKDNLNEAFYDNDILSVKLTSRKKNAFKIPYNNIKLFKESENKNEIENKNIINNNNFEKNNNIEKSKEKKEKDEKERKERMFKNISFNKKQISYNEFQDKNNISKIPIEKKNLKLDIKLPINNLESSDIIDNKMDENINIENHIGNYTTISHTNTIDNNYGKEIPKKNEENNIFFNYKGNNNNNNDLKQIIKIESNIIERNKIPKNNIKRGKAKSKSNIFNKKFIKEIISNKEEKSSKSKEKKYNINTQKSMNQTFDKNKIKISINLNNNKSEESIKTDRISHNKSPPKIINIKQSINNKNEKLNSSNNSENIVIGDLENEESKEIKINNFINKLENKFKASIPKGNETCENITIINKNKSNISKNTQDNNKVIEYKKDINYFRKYFYSSAPGKDSFGKRKINQDLHLVKINMNNIEGFNLFGVLDGHGENGHKVCRFTRDFILEEIENNITKLNSKSLQEIYAELKKDNYSIIKNAYQKVDEEISKQKFNSNFSGTTCIIVFQIGNNLISANVGDSRAILIYNDNPKDDKLEESKITELSIDQKPELPEEKKRIYKMGGIVDQMLDGKGKRNGPYRVWAGKQNYPGLAMSRSIGDLKGKSCGLISEPEIIEYELNETSKYMIICSDGVWEFLNNEDVMKIGIKYYIDNDIEGFVNDIIKTSQYWWKREDIIMDDITAVIVYF